MTDTHALALCDIKEFRSSVESRVLLEALIYFLDLKVKDPEHWPALETILHKALAQREREVWEEAAKLFEIAFEKNLVVQDVLDMCRQKGQVVDE